MHFVVFVNVCRHLSVAPRRSPILPFQCGVRFVVLIQSMACWDWNVCVRLGLTHAFSSLGAGVRKLGLEGFNDGLEINAVVDVNFGNAIGRVQGSPYEVTARVFDRFSDGGTRRSP